jgi:hypothetical protein
MTPFILYLMGSVILLGVSTYAMMRSSILGEPYGTHVGFVVASILFCLGGIAGLVGL